MSNEQRKQELLAQRAELDKQIAELDKPKWAKPVIHFIFNESDYDCDVTIDIYAEIKDIQAFRSYMTKCISAWSAMVYVHGGEFIFDRKIRNLKYQPWVDYGDSATRLRSNSTELYNMDIIPVVCSTEENAFAVAQLLIDEGVYGGE